MARRLAANITNDHLTCPICQDVLNDPRRMPCDHTFCMGCIKRLIETSRRGNVVSCPVDRKEFRAPFPDASSYHWAESFPRDDLVINLFRTIQGGYAAPAAQSKGEIPCKIHSGEFCNYFCFGCYEFACHECILESHKKDECNCMTFKKSVDHCATILDEKVEELSNLARSIDDVEVSGSTKSLRSTEKKVVESCHVMASHIEKFRDATVAKLISLLSQVENLSSSQNKTDRSRYLKDKIDAYKRYIEQTRFQQDIRDTLYCLQNFKRKVQIFSDEVLKLQSAEHAARLQFLPNPDFLKLCKVLECIDVGSLEVTAADSEDFEESQIKINEQTVNFDVDVTDKNILILESMIELSVSDASSTNVAKSSKTAKQSSFSSLGVISHSVFAVDHNNSKLMRFTDKGDPTDSLRLDGAYGMAVIPGSDDLMITQPGAKKMSRVTTHRGLEVAENIQMKQSYYSISTIDDKTFAVIAVSGGETTSSKITSTVSTARGKDKVKKKPDTPATYTVKIIDNKGKGIKTISTDAICNPETYGPPYVKPLKQITVTSSGKIVVSVETKERSFLACLNKEGESCWTYEPVGKPEGVFYAHGTVYVYLGDTKTLLMLNEDGQLQPRCCARLQHYQQSGNSLFVGGRVLGVTDLSDSINLFKMSSLIIN